MQTQTGVIGERGQVTIPKSLRERFGLRKGTRLEFEVTADGITIRRQRSETDPVWRVFGRLNRGVNTDQFIRELRDE